MCTSVNMFRFVTERILSANFLLQSTYFIVVCEFWLPRTFTTVSCCCYLPTRCGLCRGLHNENSFLEHGKYCLIMRQGYAKIIGSGQSKVCAWVFNFFRTRDTQELSNVTDEEFDASVFSGVNWAYIIYHHVKYNNK